MRRITISMLGLSFFSMSAAASPAATQARGGSSSAAIWIAEANNPYLSQHLRFSDVLTATISGMRGRGQANIRVHFPRATTPGTIASLQEAVEQRRATLDAKIQARRDARGRQVAAICIRWQDAQGKRHRLAQRIPVDLPAGYTDLQGARNALITAFGGW